MRFQSISRSIKFIKDNKAKMFWLWISYQAIKGTLTLSFIWIPLFLFWQRNGGNDGDAGKWALFGISVLVFVASHVILMRPKLKSRLENLMHPTGFLVFFCLLSLGLFSWVTFEAIHAPQIQLWTNLPWHHWVAIVLIALAVVFIVFGTRIPNPFSILGNRAPYISENPGILAVTRHPVFYGIALWALGHLIANGTLAFTLFFGSQFAFALIGAFMLDRKARKMIGTDAWAMISRKTSFLPNPMGVIAMVRDISLQSLLVRSALVILVLGTLAGLHPIVIGVDSLRMQ